MNKPARRQAAYTQPSTNTRAAPLVKSAPKKTGFISGSNSMSVSELESQLHVPDDALGTFADESVYTAYVGASEYAEVVARDQLDPKIYTEHAESLKQAGSSKRSILHGVEPHEIIPRYTGMPPSSKPGSRKPYIIDQHDPEEVLHTGNLSTTSDHETLSEF